jgi:hypothetical protein
MFFASTSQSESRGASFLHPTCVISFSACHLQCSFVHQNHCNQRGDMLETAETLQTFFSKAMLQTLLSSHHAPNASFPFGPLIQLLHKIPTLLPSQLFPQAKLPLPPPQPACLNTSLLRTNTSSLNALTSSMVRSRVFSASAHLTCRSSTKLFLRLRYLVAAVRLRESS